MTNITTILRMNLVVLCALLAGVGTAAEPDALLPGDIISISVLDHGELSISVRVQRDGTIRLPLCGTVKAAGNDAATLTTKLSESFANAGIKGASARVFVSSFAPRLVYILGEIGGGGKQLNLNPQGGLTLLQAISSSGGFLDSANQAAVSILREQANGKAERLTVNVANVINGIKGAKDVALKPGDTILIPRVKPVSVFGMVGNQGTFVIDSGRETTCSELISLAGGLEMDADLSHVLVVRPGGGTKPEPLVVNVDAVLNGDPTKDLALKPGDYVIVNTKDQVYVLGEVNMPGALSLDRKLPLTLTKAVSLTGGVTRSASRENVLVIRDGKPREANLKAILKTGSTEKDIELLPGDIVYIQ